MEKEEGLQDGSELRSKRIEWDSGGADKKRRMDVHYEFAPW